jgi:hypothetical protein
MNPTNTFLQSANVNPLQAGTSTNNTNNPQTMSRSTGGTSNPFSQYRAGNSSPTGAGMLNSGAFGQSLPSNMISGLRQSPMATSNPNGLGHNRSASPNNAMLNSGAFGAPSQPLQQNPSGFKSSNTNNSLNPFAIQTNNSVGSIDNSSSVSAAFGASGANNPSFNPHLLLNKLAKSDSLSLNDSQLQNTLNQRAQPLSQHSQTLGNKTMQGSTGPQMGVSNQSTGPNPIILPLGTQPGTPGRERSQSFTSIQDNQQNRSLSPNKILQQSQSLKNDPGTPKNAYAVYSGMKASGTPRDGSPGLRLSSQGSPNQSLTNIPANQIPITTSQIPMTTSQNVPPPGRTNSFAQNPPNTGSQRSQSAQPNSGPSQSANPPARDLSLNRGIQPPSPSGFTSQPQRVANPNNLTLSTSANNLKPPLPQGQIISTVLNNIGRPPAPISLPSNVDPSLMPIQMTLDGQTYIFDLATCVWKKQVSVKPGPVVSPALDPKSQLLQKSQAVDNDLKNLSDKQSDLADSLAAMRDKLNQSKAQNKSLEELNIYQALETKLVKTYVDKIVSLKKSATAV